MSNSSYRVVKFETRRFEIVIEAPSAEEAKFEALLISENDPDSFREDTEFYEAEFEVERTDDTQPAGDRRQ